jgi:hypothetical protein
MLVRLTSPMLSRELNKLLLRYLDEEKEEEERA